MHGADLCAGYLKVRLLLDMGTISNEPLAGDGVFATSQGGNISLVDLKSNTTTTLVKLTDVRDVSSWLVHQPYRLRLYLVGQRSSSLLGGLGAILGHEVHVDQVELSEGNLRAQRPIRQVDLYVLAMASLELWKLLHLRFNSSYTSTPYTPI